MPSIGSAKYPRGSVLVHDSDVINELALESREHTEAELNNKQESKGRRSRQTNSSTGQNGDVGMDSQSLIGHTMKVQDWLNEKTIKGLQERSDVETKEARKLYNPLLETEDTFVKDIEDFLDYKNVMEHRKKEMLHKKWNDRVYEPLRRNIIDVMDSDDWPELDRRKRELHKQYLEFVNQKGHVFLDTMDPEEYYAQALNGHRPAPISAFYELDPDDMYKVSTKPLRDPLLSQGRQRSAEDRTILRCVTGYSYTDKDIEQVKLPPLPLVPLGRHGTDSIQWLQMPLHNIESSCRLASRRRMRGVFNKSHLDQEQWDKTPQDAVQVDKEMQTQKKRMFKQVPPFPKPRKTVKIVPPNPEVQTVEVQAKVNEPETLAVSCEQTSNPPTEVLAVSCDPASNLSNQVPMQAS